MTTDKGRESEGMFQEEYHGPAPKRQRRDSSDSSCSNECTMQVVPFDWKTDDLQNAVGKNDPLLIRCWCKTLAGKVNLLLFRGFSCTVYLELPGRAVDGRRLAWNIPQIKSLKHYLDSDKCFDDCRHDRFDLVMKHKLYNADTPLVKFARLRFSNETRLKRFCYAARKKVILANIGPVEFNIHEDNVKVLTKFLARIKARCTQWFTVKCVQVKGAEKISAPRFDEYEADFETVTAICCDVVLPYKVLAFDIEVYSSVQNRFPSPLDSMNEIFAISVVTETFEGRGMPCDDIRQVEVENTGEGRKTGRKRWCLCLGSADMQSPKEVRDVDETNFPYQVLPCRDEADLILKFADLVQREDPDVVTGHNVWRFDMKYLYIRAKLILEIGLPNMGRTDGVCRTDLTSTALVPQYKQKLDNHDFVTRHLEESTDHISDDEGMVYPEQLTCESGSQIRSGTLSSASSSSANRKLIMVDGKLQLTPVHASGSQPSASQSATHRRLESLYHPPPPDGGGRKTGRTANSYMRNKIHSFMMEGRVVLDTLPACKERRMNTYTLQNVCNELMGKSKLDITPQDLFRAYRMAVLKTPTDEDVMHVAEMCGSSYVNNEGSEGGGDDGELQREAKRMYERVIYYCVKDSDLVMSLFDVMHVWTTMMEYSRCFGVTPYESLACGQQARCLSIVYVMASERGFVLDHPTSLSQDVESFVGGRVVEPTPGIYDFVMCHDFNSLYPSIIQEKNICHTTYIPVERWNEFGPGEYNSLRETKTEGNAEFRFSTRKRGIIPDLCEYLVTERKAAKRCMAEAGANAALRVSMDCRQKALKITANSMYGLMGAEVGALKLLEGSRSITCRGRQLQRRLSTLLKGKFDVVEVYGDTDSSMVTGSGNIPGRKGQPMTITSPKQAMDLGREMEDYLNGKGDIEGQFDRPIKVEMEKVMKMMVVHKKMYAYLQYRQPWDESLESPFVLDRNGEPLLSSKGLISARRDSCKACRETFEAVLKMTLMRTSPVDLLRRVSSLIRTFLQNRDERDFVKTVEIAGHYTSKSCPYNVFKRNMLKRGTKIDPRTRVEYVVIVTKDEEMHGVQALTGEKMLLLKYFDPSEFRIDNLQYLISGLKKSLDQVVAIGAAEFDKPVLIPGVGKVTLNRPVATMVRLVSCKNAKWDLGGIDMYQSLVEKASKMLNSSSTASSFTN